MAPLTPAEPQSAADYDDRTTAAVKAVLVEIGQILGSFQGKFAVIGGAVPWLLLGNEDMPHVGTLDVDLSLDAEALGDGVDDGADAEALQQRLLGDALGELVDRQARLDLADVGLAQHQLVEGNIPGGTETDFLDSTCHGGDLHDGPAGSLSLGLLTRHEESPPLSASGMLPHAPGLVGRGA